MDSLLFMQDVYFSKKIEKILDKLPLERLGKKVAIKVHFGEKGCTTYVNPEIVKKVYDKLIGMGKKAALVECNVLYKGSRTNSTDHKKTAKEHGFDFAPIDILDGEYGQEVVEVNGCKIGKGIKKYDSLLVISHFKGHIMAGFGGAIKNVGMGIGSRAGKLDMHSSIKPVIDSGKCSGCGNCIKHCNIKAITIDYKTAKINPELCEGCAMCIAVCPTGAASVPWSGGSSKRLQEKIADYTKAVLSIFSGKTFFINVLENITEDCDCFGIKQVPVMPDIGILASQDIVAVDKASLELANKKGFGKVKSSINKDNQIQTAVDLGLGNSDYKLIELF
jgi:uncharacterized protein